VLARPAIDGPTPLFVGRAPTPATGKTKVLEVVGVITTGRVPAVTTFAEGEELRKRVTSILVAASPIVLLDNMSGSVSSDVLEAALTARRWSDRVLGATQMTDLPALTVWFGTGNNLTFGKTLGRRVVPIDLDSKMERPEDRKDFKHPDLLPWVTSQRPHLVAAALTVLRAFHVAGRPSHGEPAMGSFEAWDAIVRGAVVWSYGTDPASTKSETEARGRIRATSDDEADDAVALLHALRSAFPGGARWTVSDVMKRDSLRDAVNAVAGRNGRDATAKDLRYKLRGIVNRPFGGMTLRGSKKRNNHEEARWRVEGSGDQAELPGVER
jgi:hypothetical protein